MKRIILILALSLIVAATATAQQKGVIGEKGALLTSAQWVCNPPSDNGQAAIIEFYMSSAKGAEQRVEALKTLSAKYKSRANVIVICRESADQLTSLTQGQPPYSVGTDTEGKIFADYGVRFVPYAVLVNSKGRIVWVGNPSARNGEELEKAIESLK